MVNCKWTDKCVEVQCLNSEKPTWRHCTASALTLLISMLLWGEGHLHRAESVLQNCVIGRCANLHIHTATISLLNITTTVYLCWEKKFLKKWFLIYNCGNTYLIMVNYTLFWSPALALQNSTSLTSVGLIVAKIFDFKWNKNFTTERFVFLMLPYNSTVEIVCKVNLPLEKQSAFFKKMYDLMA